MDPVTALLLGILGNVMEEIAGRLVVLFGLRLRSAERAQELAPAQVRRLVGRTADRLAELRRHEFAGLPDHEWRAAVEAVRDCLHAVAPIDLTFALDSDLEPRRMAAEIAARGAGTRNRSPSARATSTSCSTNRPATARRPLASISSGSARTEAWGRCAARDGRATGSG